jgi:hypothetical protein
MLSMSQTWAMPTAIVVLIQIVTSWYSYVQREVPEPYLVSPDNRVLFKS